MLRKVLILAMLGAVSVPATALAEEPVAPSAERDEDTSEDKLEVGKAPLAKSEEDTLGKEKNAKKRRPAREEEEDEEEEDDDDDGKQKHKSKRKASTEDEAAQEDEDEEDKPAPVKRGMPRVHIEGDDPNIELHRIESTVAIYTSRGSASGVVTSAVCSSPCDEVVDGRHGTRFFFAGPGVVSSKPFTLAGFKGDVVAKVDAGSTTRMILGITAISLGVAIAGFGVIDMTLDRAYGRTPTLGIVGLGVGALGLAGGIYLAVTSRTSYELVPRTKEDAGIRIQNGVLMF